MKRLSLLITLALVITVGGVYATWNYARNAVDSRQASATVVVTGTQSSAKGTIAITSAPARVIIDDTNGDHEGEVWFGSLDAASHPVNADQLGTVQVTFTPAASGVDADVAANGIVMKWTLTASNLGAFDIDGDGESDAIFELAQTSGLFAGGAATKSTSINLGDYIQLKEIGGKAVVLDTYAKYQAFENAISNITFTLTVSENLA